MTPRRAANVLLTPKPSESAPALNREGYPAWQRPIKEQYLQTLLTNTFGATYYAEARELVRESAAVHDAMLAEDPQFAARALLYARERGYMRTQPIYGLARLFKESAPLAAGIFNRVVRTPNDLSDFTSILKQLRKGEGGRAVKRAAGKWLVERLNPYWVIKYGAERAQGSYSLRDLLQVYHPRPPGRARLPLFDYVMGREVERWISPEMEQVRWYEELKTSKTDEHRVRCIAEGRLPHEVATAHAGSSRKVWEAIVPQLPIFALLRNLATLERHGAAESCRQTIEKKLLDPEAVRNSKILPFRFVEAVKHVQADWLADAVRGALDLAVENVPEIPGATDVAIDVSGSMAAFIQTAAVFGLALGRKAEGGRTYLFNEALAVLRTSRRDSILSQAEKIRAGGGTDHSQVMQHLLHEHRRIDNLVYITDEQQNAGSPLADYADEYRRRVNSKMKLFIIDVAPYRSAITPDDGLTYYVSGWSDQALGFISMAARGFGSMVEAIEKDAALDPEFK